MSTTYNASRACKDFCSVAALSLLGFAQASRRIIIMVSQVRRQTPRGTDTRLPSVAIIFITITRYVLTVLCHGLCSRLSSSPSPSFSFSVFLAAFFAQLTFLKCLVHRRVVYDAAQSPVCWTEGQSSQGTPGACAASNCNCCYHRRGKGKGVLSMRRT